MKRLLVQWGSKFGEAEATPIKGGVWRLQLGPEVYILKHRTNRTSVWAEYDLLAWLVANNQPISQLLCTTAQTPWAEYDGGIYVLYRFLQGTPGDQIPGLAEDYAREIGSGLARLHSDLAKYPWELEFSRFNVFQDVAGYAWPTVQGYLGIHFRHRLQEIEQEIGRNLVVPYEALPRQLIHRDFHPGNLIFQEGRLVGILDFERVRIAVRLFDLCYCCTAQLAANFKNPRRREAWPRFVQALLEGYRAVQPLSKTEAFVFLYVVYLIQFLFIAYQLDSGNKGLADLNIAMLFWIKDQHEFLEPLIEKAVQG